MWTLMDYFPMESHIFIQPNLFFEHVLLCKYGLDGE